MLRLKNPEIIKTAKFNLSAIRMTEREFVEYVLTYVKASLVAGPPSVYMIIVYIVYASLFSFGVIGNVWVVRAALKSLTSLRNHRSAITTAAINRNVVVYVLALSAADSGVLLTAPMLICALSIKRWVFGGALCKFYYVIESYNKFLSVYILVALSCDRYVSVCRPTTNVRCWRRARRSGPIMLVLMVSVTVVLTPVYIYAEQNFYDIQIPVNNATLIVELAECSLKLSDTSMAAFTWCTFVFGFCVPGVCVLYFYFRILVFIYYHSKSLLTQNTRLPLKRLTLLTLAIVFFYFACWTPYWAGMIYGQVTWSHVEQNSAIFFVLHTLVYLNSSVNWVLYAFLNRNIRFGSNRPTSTSTNLENNEPRLDQSPLAKGLARLRAYSSSAAEKNTSSGESLQMRRFIIAQKFYGSSRNGTSSNSIVFRSSITLNNNTYVTRS